MRIALAQLNPIVGDVEGNTALILDAIATARRDRAELLVTSELALIGYPPRDLLLREGVVEACERAVQVIAEAAGELHVIVGHPRRATGGTRPLRNSAAICHRGRIIDRCDKQLLPGYDVFDEDRYFEPGSRSCVVEIGSRRIGVVICEDLWRANDVLPERSYPVEPVAELARVKCDCIVSLNASPFVIGKWERHLEQLAEIATTLKSPVVAVNQVGGNDDLVFDGRSVVVGAQGLVHSMLPVFESAVETIELASPAPRQVQAEVLKWQERQREVFHALKLGLRDYCRKTGHTQALIGLSGGIDSALTAVIAAAALGPQNVHGIMMPSRFSSQGSLDDSLELARRIGLGSCKQLPIADLHESMSAALAGSMKSVAGVVDENVQARLRGIILMAHSNAMPRSLVLATSNKSELATGYSTLYGDMCGAIAVLGDMLKTRIYELSAWINRNFNELGFTQPPIPESSISKPPSAELRPNQTDQDTLPPYEILDAIIERFIEREQSAATIIEQTGIDRDLVNRTIAMIDCAQYKRDQAPVVLKVSQRAFGRGRPMPIVMKATTRIPPNVKGEPSADVHNLSAAPSMKAQSAARR